MLSFERADKILDFVVTNRVLPAFCLDIKPIKTKPCPSFIRPSIPSSFDFLCESGSLFTRPAVTPRSSRHSFSGDGSPVTCHLPPATCHLPLATCHLPVRPFASFCVVSPRCSNKSSYTMLRVLTRINAILHLTLHEIAQSCAQYVYLNAKALASIGQRRILLNHQNAEIKMYCPETKNEPF